MDNVGVYWIRNKRNGKIYIGSSTSIKKRFNVHKSRLRRNCHANPHLQSAWNKYGESAFEFRAIVICDPELTLFYEQRFLDKLSPQYNVNKLAHKPNSRVYTNEQKEKVSREHKGKVVPPDVRERMSMGRRGTKYYPPIVSPDGKVYKNIINLNKFSRDHNISCGQLHEVTSGKRKHCKGWKLWLGI